MEKHRAQIQSIGISQDESRRKRETQTISLRKKARDEMLAKRRMGVTQDAKVVVNDMQLKEDIARCKELLFSHNIEDVKFAAESFRKILSAENHPPIDAVIEANVVPKIIECLTSDNEILQYESLWCLTNIASGSHANTLYLVGLDVVEKFLYFFDSDSVKVREQACWAIGNIAGDCFEFRDHILYKDGMVKVLRLLNQETRPSILKVATWTMSNLCRGKPLPSFSQVKDAIPVAAKFIHGNDKDIVVDALWTLSFLSDGKDKRQTAVAECTSCLKLVEFLNSGELLFVVPALRVIGNLLSGEDSVTIKVIEAGALPALKGLLLSDRQGIRKEACWSLSNILAGTVEQIQQTIEEDIIPIVLHLLSVDRFDIKKEAAWCIANAVSGANHGQIIYFVAHNCIPALCTLLKFQDIELIDMTLDAFYKTLKTGKKIESEKNMPFNPYAHQIMEYGGLDTLESEAINSRNETVLKKARKIVDTFFKNTESNVGNFADQTEYSFNVSNQDTYDL